MTFVAIGAPTTLTGSFSGGQDVAIPAGAQAGDVVVCMYSFTQGGSFRSIDTATLNVGGAMAPAFASTKHDTDAFYMRAFYKEWSPGDTTITVDGNAGGSSNHIGVAMILRSIDPAVAPVVSLTTDDGGAGPQTLPDAVAADAGTAVRYAGLSGVTTYSNPSAGTLEGSFPGTNNTLAIVSEEIAGAGAIGTATVDDSGGINDRMAATMLFESIGSSGITVTPPAPEEGQTGVIVTAPGDGGTQQAVTYDGQTLNVTAYNPGSSEYTCDWPAFNVQGPGRQLRVDYDLVVGALPAIQVQTEPKAGYQYVLIGTRSPELGAGEGLYDQDTLGAGDTYVYGIGSPVDPLVQYFLDQHYINNVANGWVFTHSLFGVTEQYWSNTGTKTFVVDAAPAQPGSGTFSGDSSFQAESRRTYPAAGNFQGTAAFNAAGTPQVPASGDFQGASAFAADSRTIKRETGTFAGAAAFNAQGRISTGVSGSFAGLSQFQAEAEYIRILRGTGAFAGSAAVAADARVGGRVNGSGAFSGAATASAEARAIYKGNVVWLGTSTFSANGIIPSMTIGPVDKPGLVSLGDRGLTSLTPSRGIKGSQGG